MSDGRLWFNTKIDNSHVDKDLKALENKIRKSEETISKSSAAKLPLLKQAEQFGTELEKAKAKLADLKKQQASAAEALQGTDPAAYVEAYANKPQIDADVAAQNAEVATLQKQWDAVNGKIDDYDRKIEQANTDISRSKEKIADLNSQLLSPNQLKMTEAMGKAAKSAEGFGKRLSSIIKSALVFNLISAGLRSVVNYMGTVLKTNSEYSSQLAQLKGALLTAFQPIYEFVLPGLIAVLKILTKIVQVAANVLSFLSGKTATQSAKNAQALNKQANAIGSVGDAAEEAEKQLMGFDEINKLSSTDTSAGGGGGVGGGSPEIAPDFSGIKDMSDDLQNILGLVTAIAAGLLTWKIVSAFTDDLSLAAGLAMAVGGAFLYGFNWANAFANGIDWENLSGMLAGMLLVVGGLALAFGTVGAAVGLLITGISLVVVALREWITTGELSNEACVTLVVGIVAIGSAISLLTGSWIPLLIAGIVAFVVAAATKGDELKAVFANVINWLKGIFQRDWTELFGETLGGVLNNFFQMCSDSLDATQQVFNGLIDFIQGVFSGNWEQAMDGLASISAGAVNGIISVINAMIRSVCDGYNALASLLSFEIPYVGGISLPHISNIPQIPYLAQGAVIPPNREFLAVLGDQKSGNNIEAPEDLIRKIVREESGNGSNARLEELLETLISVVEGIEVGDDVIGKAAARYNRRASRARGL